MVFWITTMGGIPPTMMTRREERNNAKATGILRKKSMKNETNKRVIMSYTSCSTQWPAIFSIKNNTIRMPVIGMAA